MNKKLFKNLIAFAMVMAIAFTIATPVLAVVDPWGGTKGDVEAEIGLGTEDPRIIAGAVINVMLGFLGIIAVVLILFAGFKWMTAAGSEDKVAEAKKLLAAGVIGLIIILAAWGLATYVIDILLEATANV
ncbi:pilin [Patescibacteria group bacterium]|nr:pilin [Patescibacteria group bacterium]